ncbi:MAG: 2-oxo acid dehydrogenase subunit E2 [Caldilineaceae bacterium]|nr:2-oxo acid dehydrogenase subunit E2 [Caldilineaceae bacterium]
MATEVKLPELGEGVEDAAVSRWLVKVGDQVKAGDVILEVATDKVDTEVTAPADGAVLQINADEGEIVALDAVLAVIGAEGESTADDAPKAAPKPPASAPDADAADAEPASTAVEVSVNGHEVKATPVAKRIAAEKGVSLDGVTGSGPGGAITKEDVLAAADGKGPAPAQTEALPGDLADVPTLSVQRLAAEHNLDLSEIAGGRPLSALTRYDVLSAVASREAGKPVTVEPRFLAPQGAPTPAAPPEQPTSEPPAAKPTPPPSAPTEPRGGETLVAHSRMRAAVARNTTQSAFTAPHVTAWWDVDMTAVLGHRKAHKAEFAAGGVNLTVTAYLIESIVAGLKAVPAANASYTDEGVVLKHYYNVGMAVALPPDQHGLGGLIVPVIKNAGDLNLMGIARAVNDLAEKARANKLRGEDLQDGTFTLTNYGTSGSVFQTPIIVQPQVGILGTGAIEKRPVVVSNGSPLEANLGDYLTFKPMMTMALSYDHRVLDGATADAFCAEVKKALEGYR